MCKKSPSAHYHTNLLGYIFATKALIDNGKNLLNSNISSTCPHNMVIVGPLTAETGSRVWGTTANFNGFRVLTSLLQRRRSMEANRTLLDVWPSPWLVHYILGALAPAEFWQVQKFTASKSCVLLYWQHYCTALEEWASAKLCGVASLRDRTANAIDIGRSNCLVLIVTAAFCV